MTVVVEVPDGGLLAEAGLVVDPGGGAAEPGAVVVVVAPGRGAAVPVPGAVVVSVAVVAEPVSVAVVTEPVSVAVVVVATTVVEADTSVVLVVVV